MSLLISLLLPKEQPADCSLHERINNTKEFLDYRDRVSLVTDIALASMTLIIATLALLASNGINLKDLNCLSVITNHTAYIMIGTASGVIVIDLIAVIIGQMVKSKQLAEYLSEMSIHSERGKLEAEIESLKAEIQSIEDRNNKALREQDENAKAVSRTVKAASAKLLQETISKFEERIRVLNREHNKALAEVQTNLDDKYTRDTGNLKAELEKAGKEKDTLNQEIESSNGIILKLRQDLAEFEDKQRDLRNTCAGSQLDIKKLEAEIKLLQETNAELKSKWAEATENADAALKKENNDLELQKARLLKELEEATVRQKEALLKQENLQKEIDERVERTKFDELQSKLVDLEKELDKAKLDIETQRQLITQAQEIKANLETTVEVNRSTLVKVQEDLERKKAELETAEVEKKKSEAEVETLRLQIEKLEAALAEKGSTIQQNETLILNTSALLNQQTQKANELESQIELKEKHAKELNEAQQKQVENLKKQVEELEEVSKTKNMQLKLLGDEIQKLTTTEAQLKSDVDEHKKLIEEREGQKKAALEEIERLNEQITLNDKAAKAELEKATSSLQFQVEVHENYKIEAGKEIERLNAEVCRLNTLNVEAQNEILKYKNQIYMKQNFNDDLHAYVVSQREVKETEETSSTSNSSDETDSDETSSSRETDQPVNEEPSKESQTVQAEIIEDRQ